MALASTHPRLTFREDDLFFSAMATVALVVVLVGFARTYFLAGLFWAPLPSLLFRAEPGPRDLRQNLDQLPSISVLLQRIEAGSERVYDPPCGGIPGDLLPLQGSVRWFSEQQACCPGLCFLLRKRGGSRQ